MGKRGPMPKPTALRLLEGNPGKQKIKNTGEPMPNKPDKIPKPPTHLTVEAKAEWKKLAPSLWALGLLTEIDLPAFSTLCQNYANYMAVDRKLRELGEDGATAVTVSDSGMVRPHPYLKMRREYYEDWHRALGDFGLTPASRARVTVNKEPVPTTKLPGEEIDPIERMLSGG